VNSRISEYPSPSLQRDPNAMDVDATKTGVKTIQNYINRMSSHFYGCGLKTHLKINGNHSANLCGYCGKVGHFANVCQQEFLGIHLCTSASQCGTNGRGGGRAGSC
jgi:hypothetical protein